MFPMNRSDLTVALVLLAFGAFVVEESLRMPRYESIGGSAATAPGLVPGLLGAVLVLFGVVMAVRAVWPQGSPSTPAPSEDRDEDASEPTEAPEDPSAGRTRLAWILGLGLAYAGFLVGRIPFALATFLFVFVAIVVFERSEFRSARVAAIRMTIAAVIAVSVAWVVPFVFERIFLVNLP